MLATYPIACPCVDDRGSVAASVGIQHALPVGTERGADRTVLVDSCPSDIHLLQLLHGIIGYFPGPHDIWPAEECDHETVTFGGGGDDGRIDVLGDGQETAWGLKGEEFDGARLYSHDDSIRQTEADVWYLAYKTNNLDYFIGTNN